MEKYTQRGMMQLALDEYLTKPAEATRGCCLLTLCNRMLLCSCTDRVVFDWHVNQLEDTFYARRGQGIPVNDSSYIEGFLFACNGLADRAVYGEAVTIETFSSDFSSVDGTPNLYRLKKFESTKDSA